MNKDYIVRVHADPPVYFGPYTKEEAETASAELQERFGSETGTFMILPTTDAEDFAVYTAANFNHPDYIEPE